MYVNGLILVSGVLDFATLNEGQGNDLPALVFLRRTPPRRTSTKIAPRSPGRPAQGPRRSPSIHQVRISSALLQGAALPADQRSNIVAKLVRLTGLSAQVIEDNNLRVDSSTFRKMLLRDQGLILGRYDARITGRDASPAEPSPRFDPSYAAAYGPFRRP